jgi:hypothetical protein
VWEPDENPAPFLFQPADAFALRFASGKLCSI